MATIGTEIRLDVRTGRMSRRKVIKPQYITLVSRHMLQYGSDGSIIGQRRINICQLQEGDSLVVSQKALALLKTAVEEGDEEKISTAVTDLRAKGKDIKVEDTVIRQHFGATPFLRGFEPK